MNQKLLTELAVMMVRLAAILAQLGETTRPPEPQHPASPASTSNSYETQIPSTTAQTHDTSSPKPTPVDDAEIPTYIPTFQLHPKPKGKKHHTQPPTPHPQHPWIDPAQTLHPRENGDWNAPPNPTDTRKNRLNNLKDKQPRQKKTYPPKQP